jgi:6-phosphogluconolactonase
MKSKLISIVIIIIILSCKKTELSNASTNNNSNDTTIVQKPDSNKIIVKNYLLFIGTYSANIYIYSMNPKTGQLLYRGKSSTTSNPSYLTIHPNNKWLFAVNENSPGTISSFAITDSSTLTYTSSVPSKGDAPCYVSIDNSGKYVLTANYNSGSIASIPIKTDGTLGNSIFTDQHTGSSVNANRQSSPHAHSILPFALNNLLYSADLGIDQIFCYKIDTTSGILTTVSKISITAGSGPRHIAFHPNNRWMYEINELSGTIEEFTLDAISGNLNYQHTYSVLKNSSDVAAAADIHISPNGMFLYATNRDPENLIAIFSIDQQNGNLTLLGSVSSGGKTPRNFAIDPSGLFLLVANQNSNNILIFSIDKVSGTLTQVGNPISIPSPVCIKFMF